MTGCPFPFGDSCWPSGCFLAATAAIIAVGLAARSPHWIVAELRAVVAVNGIHTPALDAIVLTINVSLGATGAPIVAAIAIMTVVLVRRSAPETVRTAALIVIPWALADVVKIVVQRPRLDVAALPHQLGMEPMTLNYPSGHTAFSAALCATAVLSTRGRLRTVGVIAGAVLVIATAWSRVYLGAHYPLDVLASIVLVTVAALFVREGGGPARRRGDPPPDGENPGSASTKADDNEHTRRTSSMNSPRTDRPRLLLVEDDSQLGPLMAKVLDEVYEVTLVADGGVALDLAHAQTFDAMVVDRRLPTVDGVTIVETLRRAGSNVPMLILTALGAVHDKVRGLDAGANDYLVKPFEFDELFARLRAIRRVGNGEGPFIRVGEWEFYPDSRAVYSPFDGRVILTDRESALLKLFAINPQRTFSRGDILRAVFSANDTPGTVDTYVHYVRKKTEPGIVQTVHGLGYRLGLV